MIRRVPLVLCAPAWNEVLTSLTLWSGENVSHELEAVRDARGQGLVLFGPGWKWDAEKKELRAALAPGRPAVLAVLTNALPPPLPPELGSLTRVPCKDITDVTARPLLVVDCSFVSTAESS